MAYIPSEISYEFPKKIDLPSNLASWTINPSRSLLLIHDMQHFFLKSFDHEMKKNLIKNISLIRSWASLNDLPIVYSAQPGGMTQKQRGLLTDFWGPGMDISQEDKAIPLEISPSPDNLILTKWRYSAFFKSDLLEFMRQSGKDQLIIVGVYGHIGILMTALEAYTNDIETFIVADAIADFSEQHHNMLLTYAAERCAVVTTTGDITL